MNFMRYVIFSSSHLSTVERSGALSFSLRKMSNGHMELSTSFYLFQSKTELESGAAMSPQPMKRREGGKN